MRHWVDAVDRALADRNWYAALCVAVTLPDICGRLVDPSVKSSKVRYTRWLETYVIAPLYAGTDTKGAYRRLLSERDVYALRCALLHEGRDDISEQSARESLDAFILTYPISTSHADEPVTYFLEDGKRLQLRVDHLCRDICAGVLEWLEEVRDIAAIQQRLAASITIGPDDM